MKYATIILCTFILLGQLLHASTSTDKSSKKNKSKKVAELEPIAPKQQDVAHTSEPTDANAPTLQGLDAAMSGNTSFNTKEGKDKKDYYKKAISKLRKLEKKIKEYTAYLENEMANAGKDGKDKQSKKESVLEGEEEKADQNVPKSKKPKASVGKEILNFLGSIPTIFI